MRGKTCVHHDIFNSDSCDETPVAMRRRGRRRCRRRRSSVGSSSKTWTAAATATATMSLSSLVSFVTSFQTGGGIPFGPAVPSDLSSSSSGSSKNGGSSHPHAKHPGGWINPKPAGEKPNRNDKSCPGGSAADSSSALRLSSRTRGTRTSLPHPSFLDSPEYLLWKEDFNGDEVDLVDSGSNQQDILPIQEKPKEIAQEKVTQPQTEDVPSWLPYLFTRDQMECLKVPELKEACSERGLPKSGTKPVLQKRLLDWLHEQHQKRVDERRGTTQKTPLEDVLEYHRQLKQQRASKRKILSRRVNRIMTGSMKDDVSSRGDILFPPSEQKSGKGTDGMEEDEEEEEDDEDEARGSPTYHRRYRRPTKADVSALNRAYHAKAATFTNLEVRDMYETAKRADQDGNKRLAEKVLQELHHATPSDGRVVRRLARLAVERGEVNEGRAILQRGLRVDPSNGHLWHGLGQLELNHGNGRGGNVGAARECFKRAILAEKSLPNPYHAWGRLEQSEGNVRAAAALFRRGLRVSPRNHRLWHALGGLYREAGMYREATNAFEKGMSMGPNYSKPFFRTALAYVAYEEGDLDLARQRLREGVEHNRGKHAQGWLALAQMEESEGRIVEARAVYREAVDKYERIRNVQRRRKTKRLVREGKRGEEKLSWTSASNEHLTPRQPGDKWHHVYQNWVRMEESEGNYSMANIVYSRSAQVFPENWKVFLNWAKLQAKRGHMQRARILFEQSCRLAGRSHADPYRAYAEAEMRVGRLEVARQIYFAGAEVVTQSPDGQERGLIPMMHSWAYCEWKLGNLDRTAILLDHALRFTKEGSGGDERTRILVSMARFESCPERKNYRIAQHCICLALKEDPTGPLTGKYWRLWGDIASAMGHGDLEKECRGQAEKLELDAAAQDETFTVEGLSLLRKRLGHAPWHHKLFPAPPGGSGLMQCQDDIECI